MDVNVFGALTDLAIIAMMLIGLVAPLLIIGVLLWAAVRHLQGKRTRLDSIGNGLGRANAMNSHIQAGTPHPDDLAVPVPPGPGPRKRVRRHRSG